MVLSPRSAPPYFWMASIPALNASVNPAALQSSLRGPEAADRNRLYNCNGVRAVQLQWSQGCTAAMESGLYSCNGVRAVQLQWSQGCTAAMESGLYSCNGVRAVQLQWSQCISQIFDFLQVDETMTRTMGS